MLLYKFLTAYGNSSVLPFFSKSLPNLKTFWKIIQPNDQYLLMYVVDCMQEQILTFIIWMQGI